MNLGTQEKYENQNTKEDQLIVFIDQFFRRNKLINLSVKSKQSML